MANTNYAGFPTPPFTPAPWGTPMHWNASTPCNTPVFGGPAPAVIPLPPASWTPNLGDFDRSMRHFEHEIEVMKRNADRAFAINKPYTTELCSFPSRPTSLLEHYSFLNPVRLDVEGNRWLNCCFDLRSFKPEEVKVTLNTKERCIHVEAEHEIKESEHHIRRHYDRKFTLPEDLKVDLSKIELKSWLSSEGVLYVEAPLPKLSPVELSKNRKFHDVFGSAALTTTPIPVKNL